VLACADGRLFLPLHPQIAGWSSFKHFMTEENELELDCLDADWHKEQRDYLLHSCMWQQINPSEIIGTSTTLLEFDVGSVTQADIATFTTPFRMEITADAEVSGFGSWFDTAFEGSEASPASHPVLLTTEPPSETHWGQQARASTRSPANRTRAMWLPHGTPVTLLHPPHTPLAASLRAAPGHQPAPPHPPMSPNPRSLRPCLHPPTAATRSTPGIFFSRRCCCFIRRSPLWPATFFMARSHLAGSPRTTGCCGCG